MSFSPVCKTQNLTTPQDEERASPPALCWHPDKAWLRLDFDMTVSAGLAESAVTDQRRRKKKTNKQIKKCGQICKDYLTGLVSLSCVLVGGGWGREDLPCCRQLIPETKFCSWSNVISRVSRGRRTWLFYIAQTFLCSVLYNHWRWHTFFLLKKKFSKGDNGQVRGNTVWCLAIVLAWQDNEFVLVPAVHVCRLSQMKARTMHSYEQSVP